MTIVEKKNFIAYCDVQKSPLIAELYLEYVAAEFDEWFTRPMPMGFTTMYSFIDAIVPTGNGKVQIKFKILYSSAHYLLMYLATSAPLIQDSKFDDTRKLLVDLDQHVRDLHAKVNAGELVLDWDNQ
jgi:hypothetical protein